MKYTGIDLHSNNAVVAVIDDQDRVLYCKRLANDLSSIIAVLAPFREDLQGVVCGVNVLWTPRDYARFVVEEIGGARCR
jgi:hypothetical protein